jgi:hypothetical protein
VELDFIAVLAEIVGRLMTCDIPRRKVPAIIRLKSSLLFYTERPPDAALLNLC